MRHTAEGTDSIKRMSWHFKHDGAVSGVWGLCSHWSAPWTRPFAQSRQPGCTLHTRLERGRSRPAETCYPSSTLCEQHRASGLVAVLPVSMAVLQGIQRRCGLMQLVVLILACLFGSVSARGGESQGIWCGKRNCYDVLGCAPTFCSQCAAEGDSVLNRDTLNRDVNSTLQLPV